MSDESAPAEHQSTARPAIAAVSQVPRVLLGSFVSGHCSARHHCPTGRPPQRTQPIRPSAMPQRRSKCRIAGRVDARGHGLG